MAFKFTTIVVILAAISALSDADLARSRNRSSRFWLARQEEAAPASVDPTVDVSSTPATAPYPPAGVTPSVAFDLPTETQTEAQPDLSYGPPDNTFVPPTQPDNTYGPPAEPDNTYGPPADTTADQSQGVTPDSDTAFEPSPASLILTSYGRLQYRPVPQKLRNAQIIRSKPILVYTI